jgi:hypothetical protein
MPFNLRDMGQDDLDFLLRNGLVKVDDDVGALTPAMYCLTETGRIQAESMATRHTMVNLQTGVVSSPSTGR